MFRLAHLSDVHLSPLPPVRLRDLLSKRITGYLNWKLNRTSVLQDGILEGLVDHIKAAHPDHIAVTGDLVNLALPAEVNNARIWLNEFGEPDHISVVPGNHDAYVPGALGRVIKSWRPYMCDDGDTGGNPFPYRRDRDGVTVIGVNTGYASSPFMATGRFGKRQEKATRAILEAAGAEGRFRVVMIHHPPFKNATSWMKRLVGAAHFRDMIRQTGAELVLHGHTHIDSFEWIDGPGQPVPVIGVPSASAAPKHLAITHHLKPTARYNLFSISGEAGNWTCTMDEFGYSSDAEGVHLLRSRPVIQDGVNAL